MTEATTPTSPAVPVGSPTLDAGLTAARDRWIGYGHDPAAFDAAVAADAASSSPAPTGPAPTARPEVLPSSKTPQLTADQVASARAEWVKQGFDPAAFEAAMKADGITLDTPSAEQVAQAEHNADWGVVARDPSEYRINYLEHGGRDIPIAELAAINTEATGFLANLGLDPALGASLVERSLDVAQSLKRMTPDQQTLWKREQKAIAERRAGSPEKLSERIAEVAHAIRATGAYGPFVQGLLKAGAFDDAWIMETVANHGARIKGWQEGARK